MESRIKIGIVGCMGRMGCALVKTVQDHPKTLLIGGTVNPNSKRTNTPLDGTDLYPEISAEVLFKKADVILDFTTPQATRDHIDLAVNTNTRLVIGTTGLSKQDLNALDVAANKIAIVQAGNMSLGVTLMQVMAKKMANVLNDDFDVAIHEKHHIHKKDSPSGTALMLSEAIENNHHKKEDITFTSAREGDCVGDHSIIFSNQQECLALGHHAESRDIFAKGALSAALWVMGKKNGRYTMIDVLNMD